jgi:mannose-6-phosphate isomerase-like protein (cupin superfamily)
MAAWVKEIREDELAPVAMMPQGTWKRYVSVEADGRGMIFGMGRPEPGEEVGHAHDEEELFYVLRGHGEATWEEDSETHRAKLRPCVAFYKTSHIVTAQE